MFTEQFNSDLSCKTLQKNDSIILGDFNICLMRSTFNNDSLCFLNHRSRHAMTLLVAAAQLARELPTAFTFVLINYVKNQISAKMDHLSWFRPSQLSDDAKIMSQHWIWVVQPTIELLKASAGTFFQQLLSNSVIRGSDISLKYGAMSIKKSILNISMQRKSFLDKISPR